MKKIIITISIIATALCAFAITSCDGENKKTADETEVQVQMPEQVPVADKEIEELAKTLMNSGEYQTNSNENRNGDLKGEIVTITEENFEKITSKGLVLVDFFATWCGPCRMQRPILTDIAKEKADKITIAVLDTDKCKKLAYKFNIRSIPCMILFKNGKEVKRIIGYHDKEQLLNELSEYLK